MMESQKILSFRSFLKNEDVFADVINGLVFKGEQVVDPAQLLEYKMNDLHASQDDLLDMGLGIIKVWNNILFHIACIGMENQREEEKFAAMRAMECEASLYHNQLACLPPNISPFHSILPVITIFLYFGDDKSYAGEKYLTDFLDPNPSDPLLSSFNDYKVHVFNIPALSLEEISRFTGDFHLLASLLHYMQANETYPGSPMKPNHPQELMSLLENLTEGLFPEEIAKTFHSWQEPDEPDDFAKKAFQCLFGQIIEEYEQESIRTGKDVPFLIGEKIGVRKGEEIGMHKGEEIGVRKAFNMFKQAYRYLISCGRDSEVSRLFEDDQFRDEIVAEMQK